MRARSTVSRTRRSALSAMRSIVRTVCRRAGTHLRLNKWTPDQQRTTEPVLGPRGARTRVQGRRAAQHPGHVGGRKFLPQRHQLPGLLRRRICKKTICYWIFDHGTAFADPSAVKVKGRAMRHLSEFCHAAGSRRRVVRTGYPAIADLIEIVRSAIDRL